MTNHSFIKIIICVYLDQPFNLFCLNSLLNLFKAFIISKYLLKIGNVGVNIDIY